MRKLLLLFTIFISLTINAQEKQSVVKMKNGTTLKGVIKSIDPTDAVVISIAGVETSLKFDSISSIEEVDSNTTPIPEEKVEKVMVKVEDPLKEFKGFLLSKGNNVYVYYSNSDRNINSQYDKEAAKMIKSLLKADGFWNVVDDMNYAHFVLNYFVDTDNNDMAYLYLSSWRTGKIEKLGGKNTSESIDENISIAKKLYKSAILPLQNKIESNKLPKKMVEDFTLE